MLYKEIIDKKSSQIVNCINNFLNVFDLDNSTFIKIGTKDQNGINKCYFTILAKNYEFTKNLLVDGNIRRILYDKVLWKTIDECNNKNITTQTHIINDLQNGNSWQIIMNNKKINNCVILEFAIENEEDYRWVTSAFTNIDELNINVSKQKILNRK